MKDVALKPPPNHAIAGGEEPAGSIAAPAGANAMVWTLWLTYGAFYFCRTNISVAVPGLKGSLDAGGLGLSGDQVGWILASLKIAYGLGQLLNGQLAERFSPRIMLAIGMFGSAALNLLFGFSAGFYFLLFVWATNGFCQSLGWTPCVRVAANWVPVAKRGNAIGIIGTGYQVTLGLTYLIASQASGWLGWRGAFYVPAALLAAAGVFMLVFLRDAPPSATLVGTQHAGPSPREMPRISVSDLLYWTLYNPTLWLLGLTLGLLNACRYGFLDWGVTHLTETRSMPVDKAGLQFFVIAIGAVAGSYLAGWASDRFFGSRRAPVICLLMATLGLVSLNYDWVVRESTVGTMALLVVIGFCIYGPQVLLVGTAPADLAHRGTSAAAAGFVNFMGYMGAATGDVVTGYFSSPEHGGWEVAIYIWAGWAFVGAMIVGLLWNATTHKAGILPGAIPKVAALLTMALAGAAVMLGDQSLAVRIVTFVGIGCVLATFAMRVAALPLLLIAGGGLLAVFTAFVQAGQRVTCEQSTAMVSFGLTLVLGLMILVEKKDLSCE